MVWKLTFNNFIATGSVLWWNEVIALMIWLKYDAEIISFSYLILKFPRRLKSSCKINLRRFNCAKQRTVDSRPVSRFWVENPERVADVLKKWIESKAAEDEVKWSK